jgi:hypothetical protein
VQDLPHLWNADDGAAGITLVPWSNTYDANVRMVVCGYAGALDAGAARSPGLFQAVEGLGQFDRQGHLANVLRSGQQVRVGELARFEPGFQPPQYVVLSY